MPTDAWLRPATPAGSPPCSSVNELVSPQIKRADGVPRPICAIHQPNFLPRLSTLAKLYASDYWIVLNDVQFVRRDYQHRARLASLTDPDDQFWLTLPVHLPNGRATLIRDVTVVEPDPTRHKIEQTLQHVYGRSPLWSGIREILEPALALITDDAPLQDISETSTRVLLEALGWTGKVVRSDTYKARSERSSRLVDLTLATGSQTYLCGTGGARYLDQNAFARAGLDVRYVRPAGRTGQSTWSSVRRLTALDTLSTAPRNDVESLLRKTFDISL